MKDTNTKPCFNGNGINQQIKEKYEHLYITAQDRGYDYICTGKSNHQKKVTIKLKKKG